MANEVTPEEGGARVNYRVPEPMAAKVRDVGEMLGYTSLSAAARHCMVIGLQVLLPQLSTARIAESHAQMANAMDPEDMAKAMIKGVESGMREGTREAVSLEGAVSAMLDTTATSRHQKHGVVRLK